MSAFEILRCTEGTSDKVWIARDSAISGHYDCWYGPTKAAFDGSLTARVCKGNLYNKLREKTRKGYKDWTGMAFDEATGCITQAQSTVTPEPVLPPRFWYRIDTRLFSVQEAQQLVVEMSENLKRHENRDIQAFAEEFESLSVVQQIRDGKEAGGSEYSEGVLGLFFVHALHRRINAQVCDDSNAALPRRFGDLDAHIQQCWHWTGLSMVGDKALIKELAMTFGCLDRPAGATLEQRRKIARSVSF